MPKQLNRSNCTKYTQTNVLTRIAAIIRKLQNLYYYIWISGKLYKLLQMVQGSTVEKYFSTAEVRKRA